MINVTTTDGESLPTIRYENTLPGCCDLYLAINAIAEVAYTTDDIMDAIGEVRSLLRNEIMTRPAITDADVAAKVRLAAHLIKDPASIWPEDVALLTEAIERLSSLRVAA